MLSQATRGKEEVTAELAKILSVLQTTLTANNDEDDDESDSSDESSDSSEEEDEDQGTTDSTTGQQSTPQSSAAQEAVETSNNAPAPPLVSFDLGIFENIWKKRKGMEVRLLNGVFRLVRLLAYVAVLPCTPLRNWAIG